MANELKVIWRITRVCNLHCLHCLAGFGNRFRRDLDRSEQLVCLDRIAAVGITRLTWAGGEPTLSPSFLPLLERCHHYNITTVLTTHGLLLRPEIVEALLPARDVIRLSFDGLEATHNEVRGGPYFSATLAVIPRLLDHGLQVEANVTLMSRNIGEVPRLLELLVDNGVSKIVLLSLVSRESAVVNGIQGCAWNEFLQVRKNVEAILARNDRVKIELNNYLDEGSKYVVIESDGEILLCSERVGDKSFGCLHFATGEQALRLALSRQSLRHRTISVK
jgi:MoaA/NifB/PqqE/SkfB family radical SAM enzyme